MDLYESEASLACVAVLGLVDLCEFEAGLACIAVLGQPGI